MSMTGSHATVSGSFDIAAELSQQKLRTAAIEFEVALLREKLNELSGASEAALPSVSPETLSAIVQITRELFDAEPQADVLHDPEEPGFPFLVFTVKWIGEAEQLLAKRRSWHARVRDAFPDPLHHPRLSVVAS